MEKQEEKTGGNWCDWLKREVKKKESDLKNLDLVQEAISKKIKAVLSVYDFDCVSKAIDTSLKITRDKDRIRLGRKLLKLKFSGKHNGLGRDMQGGNRRIVNLSKTALSDVQVKLLEKGLDFAVKNRKFNLDDVKVNLEMAAYDLQKFKKLDKVSIDKVKGKVNMEIDNYKKDLLSEIRVRKGLSKMEVAELNKLKKDPNIIITKFDKGKGVAILDKQEYDAKILDYLNGSGNFVKIAGDELKLLILEEERITRVLKNGKEKGVFTEDEYKNLKPQGTRAGKVFGLPKVHKDNVPIRPIISMLNTPGYKLGKWLQKYVKPLSLGKYGVKDTFEAVDKIKNVVLSAESTIVSFDVKNFFPSVPIKKAIDLITEKVFQNDNCKPHCTKDFFREMLLYVNLGCLVKYEGQVWKQVEGVAMGSPLSADISNAFLSIIEEKKLTTDCQPKCYMRYVDDTLAVFENVQKQESFFQYINTWDNKLEFTKESYGENGLSFLDIKLKRVGNVLETEVFHKETDTDLVMQFESNIPMKYKKGLIGCLVIRALRVCSNWANVHKEINIIREKLVKNGFPIGMIEHEVNKILDKWNANRIGQKR